MKIISKNVVVSCFLAGCLEIYDFTIFGFLVPILNKNYLSFLDNTNATIVAYALFAVGFLFRPIGSIIFGYIGDIYGRKKSLVLSMSLMGSASLLMCIIPTYDSIGVVSCYLIVLARVTQGLSVGGEYSGALIYAIEHFDKKYTAFIGGLLVSGCVSGILLANIVSYITQLSTMPEYSWRFAFLLGFALSAIGFYIRKKLKETAEFKNIAKVKNSSIPLIDGIKDNLAECLVTVVITGVNSINFYFMLFFLPNYINSITNIPFAYYSTISISFVVLLAPIFCIFSQKIGRLKLIWFGSLVTGLLCTIGLQVLYIYPTIFSAIIFFCCFGIIQASMIGVINVLVIEIFPIKCRFSCSSFFYSIGMALFGGTAPMIGSMIVKLDNALRYICLYIATGSIICCISIIFFYWYRLNTNNSIFFTKRSRLSQNNLINNL